VKNIVIMGGGIAGLSAGIFAQKNGFQSTILERNHNLGGECTGWDRQGYHIDGCIHWLVGTKEGTPLRHLWDTVGALRGVDIYHPESFMAVEHEDTTVHFYRDLERLRASWVGISPADKGAIDEFCGDIQRLHTFSIPCEKPMDLMSILEKARFMLSMKDVAPVMRKYGKISIQDLAAKFKHPALHEAIVSFMPEGDYSAISVLFPLGTFTSGQASIPKGGSKALAMRMTEEYLSAGGKVETACQASAAEIKGGRVKSIISDSGKRFSAEYFIAACDPKVLFEDLLVGEYRDKEYETRYNDPITYPLASNIYVALGYAGTMNDIPRTVKFVVEGIDIQQNQLPVTQLQMTHYGYEPDFAPEGHTVITFAINQFEPELHSWEGLVADKVVYTKEKLRIGNAVIAATEKRFPQMKDKLKLLDVATPQTYVRYCRAFRGAFMGFWPTIRGKLLSHSGRIKGLDNLFLSGQWLQPPGGLPVAVITGKDTIMRICVKEKQPFTAY
jgi:phytoene desaturase